ncbi:HTH-type transcriptional regulator MalT [Balneatrix alpica]|uniref:HTH-type transcriptional regulator MalT n=1 Tax=Balneatrix alpica TaxID=75684 RepID=A0ABV5ZCM3_9GAMM|nr:HTH-type transcriptional regulator MalT [Balneatrix alpica]
MNKPGASVWPRQTEAVSPSASFIGQALQAQARGSYPADRAILRTSPGDNWSERVPEALLIPAKIQLPELHNDWLWRTRFDDILQAELGHHALILVRAPAGSGKTTLLAGWADQQDHPVAWYSLDQSDNDAERFGLYLLSSLHQACGQGLPVTLELAHQRRFASLEELFTHAFNELAGLRNPVLLVLDDYHLIQAEAIHQSIRFLLKHRPPALTLAIASRTLPPIGIAQLRVHGQLLEIDATTLAFSNEEAQEFFQQRLPYELSREQIQRLNRRVEGWPAALQLAVQSAPTKAGFDAFSEQLSLGNSYIRDFLEEEAFAGLGEELRDFLLCTGLLDRFNASMVSQVSEGRFGQSQLEQVERLGLFIRPLDNARQWYRYQQIFANFLQHQLHHLGGERLRWLHQRAADAWLVQGVPEEAARHAVAAQDSERILQLLLSWGRHFYRQAEFKVLQGCLDALAPEQIAATPILTLLQAWSLQAQYHFDDVEVLLKRGEQSLKQRCSPEEWESIEAEFSAVRAQVAMNQGHTEQAIKLATRALAQQPEHMRSSRTAACSVLGEAAFVRGELEEARQRMEEAEQLARSQDAHQIVLWTLAQQSEIQIAKGFLQKAYNLQEKALSYAQEHQVQRLPILEFIYRIRAQVLWEWQNLDTAEQATLRAMEIMEGREEHWFLQNYALLGKIAQSRGKQAICADYVEKIQRMLASGEYHSDWTANAHATLLSYWEAVQDQDAISHWLTLAPPLAEEAVNHFTQCNARNRVRACLSLGRLSEAQQLLEQIQAQAEQKGLLMDQNRNLIYQAQCAWQQDRREAALAYLAEALQLASQTGALGSFLRMGKPLIMLLKALLQQGNLDELARHRAERLVQQAQQQRDFSRAIRINLDEAVIQDIINRPDVPELIRTSPLTRREWQVLSLIHTGLSNEQIADHLKVAATTIKTHIRSLYQKLNITQRSEAIALARDLLSKIQGE